MREVVLSISLLRIWLQILFGSAHARVIRFQTFQVMMSMVILLSGLEQVAAPAGGLAEPHELRRISLEGGSCCSAMDSQGAS